MRYFKVLFFLIIILGLSSCSNISGKLSLKKYSEKKIDKIQYSRNLRLSHMQEAVEIDFKESIVKQYLKVNRNIDNESDLSFNEKEIKEASPDNFNEINEAVFKIIEINQKSKIKLQNEIQYLNLDVLKEHKGKTEKNEEKKTYFEGLHSKSWCLKIWYEDGTEDSVIGGTKKPIAIVDLLTQIDKEVIEGNVIQEPNENLNPKRPDGISINEEGFLANIDNPVLGAFSLTLKNATKSSLANNLVEITYEYKNYEIDGGLHVRNLLVYDIDGNMGEQTNIEAVKDISKGETKEFKAIYKMPYDMAEETDIYVIYEEENFLKCDFLISISN